MHSASDWATTRGEKWVRQLAGLETMMTPVDEPLIHALQLQTPCRIADIGCGGGGTSLQIVRRAPAGSVVNGFDISPAAIEAARTRTQSAVATALSFAVANVATAPVPDKRYDRLVSRFGIMFFDDPAKAFANLAGWVVPGGRFAFAVWGPLAENAWTTSIREVAAALVNVPPVDPEAPGPFRYADAGKLLTLLAAAGFGELEVSDWRGKLCVGGGLAAKEAANFALASFSSFGDQLAEAGEETLENARRLLTTRFAQYEHEGFVRMDASVHIISGARSTS